MTAVEWLIENTSMFKDIWKEEIKQAKEMEKQQIIDAFKEGYDSGYRDNGKLGSEYYDETFKNK